MFVSNLLFIQFYTFYFMHSYFTLCCTFYFTVFSLSFPFFPPWLFFSFFLCLHLLYVLSFFEIAHDFKSRVIQSMQDFAPSSK